MSINFFLKMYSLRLMIFSFMMVRSHYKLLAPDTFYGLILQIVIILIIQNKFMISYGDCFLSQKLLDK